MGNVLPSSVSTFNVQLTLPTWKRAIKLKVGGPLVAGPEPIASKPIQSIAQSVQPQIMKSLPPLMGSQSQVTYPSVNLKEVKPAKLPVPDMQQGAGVAPAIVPFTTNYVRTPPDKSFEPIPVNTNAEIAGLGTTDIPDGELKEAGIFTYTLGSSGADNAFPVLEVPKEKIPSEGVSLEQPVLPVRHETKPSAKGMDLLGGRSMDIRYYSFGPFRSIDIVA